MVRRIAFLVLLATAGCKARTELMVGVITDLRAPDLLNMVDLQVKRDGVPLGDPSHTWNIPGGKSNTFVLPGSYGLYEAAGDATRVEVTLTGLKDGNRVVERTALVSLVPEKTLFMRMAIVVGCMGKFDCAAGQTCIEGLCKDTAVDERTLPLFSPELVDHVTCDSGTKFISTEDGSPVPPMGDMNCLGACVEGTCYNPPPDDAGAGQLWTPQITPPSVATLNVRAAWGTTATGYDVFGVGDNGLTLHLAGNGANNGTGGSGGQAASSWIDERTDPKGETLFGVGGTRVDDVWAVGANATIRHRTGQGWTTIDPTLFALPAGAELHGVWAASAQSVWVVGRTSDGQSLVLHLNGGEWAQDRTFPGVGDLKAVSGAGNVVYVAGLGGSLYRFDGTAWSSMTNPDGMKVDLFGIWALSATEGYAVGQGGSIVYFSNGKAGTPSFKASVPDLRAVFGLSRDEIYVVGDNGTILSASNNGAHFSTEDSGGMLPLYGVWGAGPGDIYAVGQNGTVLHRMGAHSGGSGGISVPDFGAPNSSEPEMGSFEPPDMSMLPSSCQPTMCKADGMGGCNCTQACPDGLRGVTCSPTQCTCLLSGSPMNSFANDGLCNPDGQGAFDNCFPPPS